MSEALPLAEPQEQAPPRPPREPRFLSPITRRILAVNVLALALLVTGIMYLGEYRRSLIQAELEGLATHAEMMAAALAEGAVAANAPFATQFVREAARQMLYRLVETSRTRARLFGPEGDMMIDSLALGVTRGVEAEELGPPDEAVEGLLWRAYHALLHWMPADDQLAPYVEHPVQHAIHYGEVVEALRGERAAMVRRLPEGRLVLSVAVPVQRYKQVLGTVMLSKGSEDIEAALVEVRLDILRVFALALAVTVLLSVYLAGTIARPLNRLAAAADRVRLGAHRQHAIPDMSGRGDEIGDLSAALRDMTEELRRRFDAIERFAADVAHEIKNPLTSLRSAVETVARVDDRATRDKLMAVIEADVKRLDRLISDISDASRLDSELSRAEVQELDLGALLETLADVHETTRKPDQPRIRLERANAKPIRINGIEGRLVQVFRNVIGNAVTFSPPDGTIVIKVERAKSMVVVTIDDDGPGIPEGKTGAIFERFYTERPSSEAFGTHSGLGLSISRQIVAAHGGTITAENRLARDGRAKDGRAKDGRAKDGQAKDGRVLGARFVIRLPAGL